MSNTAYAVDNDYMVPLEVLEDIKSSKVPLKPPVSRPLPQRPSQVQDEMQRFEAGTPTKCYKCRWIMVGAIIAVVILVAIAVPCYWFLTDGTYR